MAETPDDTDNEDEIEQPPGTKPATKKMGVEGNGGPGSSSNGPGGPVPDSTPGPGAPTANGGDHNGDRVNGSVHSDARQPAPISAFIPPPIPQPHGYPWPPVTFHGIDGPRPADGVDIGADGIEAGHMAGRQQALAAVRRAIDRLPARQREGLDVNGLMQSLQNDPSATTISLNQLANRIAERDKTKQISPITLANIIAKETDFRNKPDNMRVISSLLHGRTDLLGRCLRGIRDNYMTEARLQRLAAMDDSSLRGFLIMAGQPAHSSERLSPEAVGKLLDLPAAEFNQLNERFTVRGTYAIDANGIARLGQILKLSDNDRLSLQNLSKKGVEQPVIDRLTQMRTDGTLTSASLQLYERAILANHITPDTLSKIIALEPERRPVIDQLISRQLNPADQASTGTKPAPPQSFNQLINNIASENPPPSLEIWQWYGQATLVLKPDPTTAPELSEFHRAPSVSEYKRWFAQPAAYRNAYIELLQSLDISPAEQRQLIDRCISKSKIDTVQQAMQQGILDKKLAAQALSLDPGSVPFAGGSITIPSKQGEPFLNILRQELNKPPDDRLLNQDDYAVLLARTKATATEPAEIDGNSMLLIYNARNSGQIDKEAFDQLVHLDRGRFHSYASGLTELDGVAIKQLLLVDASSDKINDYVRSIKGTEEGLRTDIITIAKDYATRIGSAAPKSIQDGGEFTQAHRMRFGVLMHHYGLNPDKPNDIRRALGLSVQALSIQKEFDINLADALAVADLRRNGGQLRIDKDMITQARTARSIAGVHEIQLDVKDSLLCAAIMRNRGVKAGSELQFRYVSEAVEALDGVYSILNANKDISLGTALKVNTFEQSMHQQPLYPSIEPFDRLLAEIKFTDPLSPEKVKEDLISKLTEQHEQAGRGQGDPQMQARLLAVKQALIDNTSEGHALLRHVQSLGSFNWQIVQGNTNLSLLNQEQLTRAMESVTAQRLQNLPTTAEQQQLKARLFEAARNLASKGLNGEGREQFIKAWIDIARAPSKMRGAADKGREKERCLTIAKMVSPSDLGKLNDKDFRALAESVQSQKAFTTSEQKERAELIMKFIKEAEYRPVGLHDKAKAPEWKNKVQGDLIKQLVAHRPNDKRPDTTRDWPVDLLNKEDLDWLKDCLSRRLAQRDAQGSIPGLPSTEQSARNIAASIEDKPLTVQNIETLFGKIDAADRPLALQLLAQRAQYLSADGWHQQLKALAIELHEPKNRNWIQSESLFTNFNRNTEAVNALCFANDTAGRAAAYEFRKQTGVAVNIKELKPSESLPPGKFVLFSALDKAPNGDLRSSIEKSPDVFKPEAVLQFDRGLNYLDMAALTVNPSLTQGRLRQMVNTAKVDENTPTIKEPYSNVHGAQAELECLQASIAEANKDSAEKREIRVMIYFDEWSGRPNSPNSSSAQMAAHVMDKTIESLSAQEMMAKTRQLHAQISRAGSGSSEIKTENMIFILGGSARQTNQVRTYGTDSNNLITHMYRQANGLADGSHDSQFVTLDDAVEALKTNPDQYHGKTIVFVDDVHYTGSRGRNQISTKKDQKVKLGKLAKIVQGKAEIVYGTLGAHPEGLDRVSNAATRAGTGIRVENVTLHKGPLPTAKAAIRSLNGRSSGEFRMVQAGRAAGSAAGEQAARQPSQRVDKARTGSIDKVAKKILGSVKNWRDLHAVSAVVLRHMHSYWLPRNLETLAKHMNVPGNHNESRATDLVSEALRTAGGASDLQSRRAQFAKLLSPATTDLAKSYNETIMGIWQPYADAEQIQNAEDAAFALKEGLETFITANRGNFSDDMGLSGRPVEIRFAGQAPGEYSKDTLVIELDPKYAEPANAQAAQAEIFRKILEKRAIEVWQQHMGGNAAEIDIATQAVHLAVTDKMTEAFGAQYTNPDPGRPINLVDSITRDRDRVEDPPGDIDRVRDGVGDPAGDADRVRDGVGDPVGDPDHAADGVGNPAGDTNRARDGAGDPTGDADRAPDSDTPRSTINIHNLADKLQCQKEAALQSTQSILESTRAALGPNAKLSFKDLGVNAKLDSAGNPANGKFKAICTFKQPVTIQTGDGPLTIHTITCTQDATGNVKLSASGQGFDAGGKPIPITPDMSDSLVNRPIINPLRESLGLDFSTETAANAAVRNIGLYFDQLNKVQFNSGADRFADFRGGLWTHAQPLGFADISADEIALVIEEFVKDIPLGEEPLSKGLKIVANPDLAPDQPVRLEFIQGDTAADLHPRLQISQQRLEAIKAAQGGDPQAMAAKLYAEIEDCLAQIDQMTSLDERLAEIISLSSHELSIDEVKELADALARADSSVLTAQSAEAARSNTPAESGPDASIRNSRVASSSGYHLSVNPDGQIKVGNRKALSRQSKETMEDYSRRFIAEIDGAFTEAILNETDDSKIKALEEQRDSLLRNENGRLKSLYEHIHTANLASRAARGSACTLAGAGLAVSAMIVWDFAEGTARAAEAQLHESSTPVRLPKTLPNNNPLPKIDNAVQRTDVTTSGATPGNDSATADHDTSIENIKPLSYDEESPAHQQAMQELQAELSKQLPHIIQGQLEEQLTRNNVTLPGFSPKLRQAIANALTSKQITPQTQALIQTALKSNSLSQTANMALNTPDWPNKFSFLMTNELAKGIFKPEFIKEALTAEQASQTYGPVSQLTYNQVAKLAANTATQKLHEFAAGGISSIPSGCPITWADNLTQDELLKAMSEAKVALETQAGQMPDIHEIDRFFNTDHWNDKAQAILDKPQQKAQERFLDKAVALANKPGWVYRADKDNPALSRVQWEAAITPLINLHSQATTTMESLQVLSRHIYNSADKAWVKRAIDEFKKQNIGSIQYDSDRKIERFKINLPDTCKLDRPAVKQMQKTQAWLDKYSRPAQDEIRPIIRATNMDQVCLLSDVVKDKFSGLPPLSPHGKEYNLIRNRFNVSTVASDDQKDIAHRGMIRVETLATYHNAGYSNPYNHGAPEVDRKVEGVAYYNEADLVPIVSGNNLYFAMADKLAKWQSSETRWNTAHQAAQPLVDGALMLMGGVTLAGSIKLGVKASTMAAARVAANQAVKGSFEIALGLSGPFVSNAASQQHMLGRSLAYARGAVFAYGAAKHVLQAADGTMTAMGNWLAARQVATVVKESEQAAQGLARLAQLPAEAVFTGATPWFFYTMGKDKIDNALHAAARQLGPNLIPRLEEMGVISKQSGHMDVTKATQSFLRFMENTAAEHFLNTSANILNNGAQPDVQAKVKEALNMASQAVSSPGKLEQTQAELMQKFETVQEDRDKVACAIAFLQCAQAQDKSAENNSQARATVERFLDSMLERSSPADSQTRFAAANALFQNGKLTSQEFAWECDRVLNTNGTGKELRKQALLGCTISAWTARNQEGQGTPQQQYEYVSRSFGVTSADLTRRLADVASGANENDPDLRAFAGSLLHAINRGDQAERATLLAQTVQDWQNHQGQPGSFAQTFLARMQADLDFAPKQGQSFADIETDRMRQFSAAATLLTIKGNNTDLQLSDKSIEVSQIRQSLADCVSPLFPGMAAQAASMLLIENGGSLPPEQAAQVRRQCLASLYSNANIESKLNIMTIMPNLARGASNEEIASIVRTLSSICTPSKSNTNYASNQPDLRKQAIEALSTINCPQSLATIENLLNSATLDPSVAVRDASLKGLAHLHPEKLSQILTTYLNKEHDTGLKEIGKAMLAQNKMHNDPVTANSAANNSAPSANGPTGTTRNFALQAEFAKHRSEEWFRTNFPDLVHNSFMAKVNASLPSYMSSNEHIGELRTADGSFATYVEHLEDSRKTFDYSDPFLTPEKRIANQVRNLSIDYKQGVDTLIRWAKGEFTPHEMQSNPGALKATREEACRALAMVVARDGRSANGLPLLRDWDRSNLAAVAAKGLAEMCRPGIAASPAARKQAADYVIALLQNSSINPQARCALLPALSYLSQSPALLSGDQTAKLLSASLQAHRALGQMPEDKPEPQRSNYPEPWQYDKARAQWQTERVQSLSFQLQAAEQLVKMHMDREDGIPLLSRIAQETKSPYLKERVRAYQLQLESGVEIAYLSKIEAKTQDTITPAEIRANNIRTALAQLKNNPGSLVAARRAVDVIFDNALGQPLGASNASQPLISALGLALYSDNERVRLASASVFASASDLIFARQGIDRLHELAQYAQNTAIKQDAAARLKDINRQINANITNTELRLRNLKEARELVTRNPSTLNDRQKKVLQQYKGSNPSFDELEMRQSQVLASWRHFKDVISSSQAETNQRHSHR